MTTQKGESIMSVTYCLHRLPVGGGRRIIGMAGWMVAAMLWAVASQAQSTAVLDDDQHLDADPAEDITFASTTGTVSRSGDGSAGDPWIYDFSALALGSGGTVDLYDYKLYHEGRSDETDQRNIILDLADYHLAGSGPLAIRTYQGVTQRPSDNLVVTNAATIAMGGIDGRVRQTSGGNTTHAQIGDVTILSDGDIRLDYIWAYGDKTSGYIASYGGDVSIRGGGDVKIADSSDVAGDILTYVPTSDERGGDVTVAHAGDFLVGNINTKNFSGSGGGANPGWRPGNVFLDGGDSSGDAMVKGYLQFHEGAERYRAGQATLEIKNYNNVTIEDDIVAKPKDINTDYDHLKSLEVFIKDGIAGDIALLGQIDLEDTGRGSHGTLDLVADGTVTLAAIDLDKVGYAYLSSGTDSSLITGAVSNFDTNSPSGGGTPANPYVTDETRLRAPAGESIYYTYEDGGLNDELGGYAWQLKDLDGTTDGGLLMTEPVFTGSVIIMR